MKQKCKNCGGYHDSSKTQMAKKHLVQNCMQLKEAYKMRDEVDEKVMELEKYVLACQLAIFVSGD